MTTRKYKRNGDFVDKLIDTGTPPNNPARTTSVAKYRNLYITSDSGEVGNDGVDTETITIEVVDGSEVARGTNPRNATVLDYDGDVTLTFDGVEMTKMFTNGSVSFDLTTDKPAGSEIEMVAESLTNHPAESDSATIEVVSP